MINTYSDKVELKEHINNQYENTYIHAMVGYIQAMTGIERDNIRLRLKDFNLASEKIAYLNDKIKLIKGI